MAYTQSDGGADIRTDFQDIITATMVILKEPEAIPLRPKAKRRLTNNKLRALAAKHQPPQSWYDNDGDEFC